jgi:aryl-alcohol dehydrogenase-like predicted oxidoreductase
MASDQPLGGRFTFPGGPTVNRMGYGAMQLAGKGVFGPPKDEAGCIAVLRAAVEAGVDHIDTSDFYGPHVVNHIIKTALHPYPEALTIVTKVGAKRGEDGSWNVAISAAELTQAVHDNLKNLGVEALDVVNYRHMGGGAGHGPAEGSIEAPFTALAELQRQGLIRHLGVSNVTLNQVEQARSIAPVVCVQNLYNVAHREDDALIDHLAGEGIAYVPFFPLGGFAPLQSEALERAAKALGATSLQTALAWLLERSPNILLIPGTSSVNHLGENLAASSLLIPPDVLADLDKIAG